MRNKSSDHLLSLDKVGFQGRDPASFFAKLIELLYRLEEQQRQIIKLLEENKLNSGNQIIKEIARRVAIGDKAALKEYNKFQKGRN